MPMMLRMTWNGIVLDAYDKLTLRLCSFRLNASGEPIEAEENAYHYEEDIQRMHVLFELYILYEQVTPSTESSSEHSSTTCVILGVVEVPHLCTVFSECMSIADQKNKSSKQGSIRLEFHPQDGAQLWRCCQGSA